MKEMMSAREEELLQAAAYWLLHERDWMLHTIHASSATDELPGRVMRGRWSEDDDRLAWDHARRMFVVLLDCITDDPDEREWLLVKFPTMSERDCVALVMEGVRVMQEIVDRNPWQYGVVQDRQHYVERGILTAVEAWDSLTDLLGP